MKLSFNKLFASVVAATALVGSVEGTKGSFRALEGQDEGKDFAHRMELARGGGGGMRDGTSHFMAKKGPGGLLNWLLAGSSGNGSKEEEDEVAAEAASIGMSDGGGSNSAVTRSRKLASCELINLPTDIETGLPLDPGGCDPNLCSCDLDSCTSNDLEAVGASIDLGQQCFECEPCTEVTGDLIVAIDNGTGSQRTTFGFSATLKEIFDPSCVSTGEPPMESCTEGRCTDGGALAPNTITFQNFGAFTYTCGSRLVLEDLWQWWSSASAGDDCLSQSTCKNGANSISPKCGVAESLEISPPLSIQEVNAGCDAGANTISIDVDVFGGTGPYTYSWKNMANVEVATTEDLTSVADDVYTLTVMDSGRCTTSKSFGSYTCCTPSEEVCDGVDNDCDGQVDEGFDPTPTSCGVGACASTGQLECQGAAGLVDTCAPGTPGEEVCDGVDNDCDGEVDETIDCLFTIESSFSGSDIQVTILLQTLDDGSGVEITVTETDSALIGDIRGVFFHVKDESKLVGMTITGDDVTTTQISANSVQDLGNGAIMTGDRNRHKYDVGVEIGSQGIGANGDDIQSTTFIVTGVTTEDFTNGEEFGVRLTSVGPEGGNRGDSSKVVGYPNCCYLARRQLHSLRHGF